MGYYIKPLKPGNGNDENNAFGPEDRRYIRDFFTNAYRTGLSCLANAYRIPAKLGKLGRGYKIAMALLPAGMTFIGAGMGLIDDPCTKGLFYNLGAGMIGAGSMSALDQYFQDIEDGSEEKVTEILKKNTKLLGKVLKKERDIIDGLGELEAMEEKHIHDSKRLRQQQHEEQEVPGRYLVDETPKPDEPGGPFGYDDVGSLDAGKDCYGDHGIVGFGTMSRRWAAK